MPAKNSRKFPQFSMYMRKLSQLGVRNMHARGHVFGQKCGHLICMGRAFLVGENFPFLQVRWQRGNFSEYELSLPEEVSMGTKQALLVVWLMGALVLNHSCGTGSILLDLWDAALMAYTLKYT